MVKVIPIQHRLTISGWSMLPHNIDHHDNFKKITKNVRLEK